MTGREAEPGSLPGLLGREERLEDPLQRFAAHPGAGIGDRQQHEFARPAIGDAQRFGGGDGGILQAEREPAAVGHRVAGIDRHVEHDLLNLAGVGHCLPEISARSRSEREIFSPIRRRTIPSTCVSSRFRSSERGWSTCLRLKASS